MFTAAQVLGVGLVHGAFSMRIVIVQSCSISAGAAAAARC
jgi:hypothetical protein